MFVLFFETGWPHGRGLVFREPRILILPCHAASTLSTEHPLVIHVTTKKNSVAWKWPVNAVKELLELQNETGSSTSAHSAAVPDTNAEINMQDGYYNNALQAASWGSYERVYTEGTRRWCNYCLMGVQTSISL
jgi:hypothetical protein